MNEHTTCPYCEQDGLVEMSRNAFNIMYECPLCGLMTSTEIDSVLEKLRAIHSEYRQKQMHYVTVSPEAKQRLMDEHGLTEDDFFTESDQP